MNTKRAIGVLVACKLKFASCVMKICVKALKF